MDLSTPHCEFFGGMVDWVLSQASTLLSDDTTYPLASTTNTGVTWAFFDQDASSPGDVVTNQELVTLIGSGWDVFFDNPNTSSGPGTKLMRRRAIHPWLAPEQLPIHLVRL